MHACPKTSQPFLPNALLDHMAPLGLVQCVPGISHSMAYRSFVLFLCAELEYAEALIPSVINVYETYNPGAVVRILACNSDPAEKNNPGEVE